MSSPRPRARADRIGGARELGGHRARDVDRHREEGDAGAQLLRRIDEHRVDVEVLLRACHAVALRLLELDERGVGVLGRLEHERVAERDESLERVGRDVLPRE